MSAPSVFADEFVLVGLRHTRCAKPTTALTPEKHLEFTLPAEIGRAHLDIYTDRHAEQMYGRLYHMQSGEVAWYRVAFHGAPLRPEWIRFLLLKASTTSTSWMRRSTCRARWEYIRSASEPCVLIHPYTGETYRRRDGQPWPQMAYVLERDKTDTLSRYTRATWGDANGILPLTVPA